MLPSRATPPARIFVPPRSTPIAWPACTVGTVNLRMAASGEKPYRVYRGGRDKGKVPLARREREARRGGGRGGARAAGGGDKGKGRPARREREARRPVRSDGSGPGRIVERRPRRRLWLGWTLRRWT